ncbi:serine/threonine-protein kinase [Nocardia sp. NPDC049707]|uniref:serine/threonine-protein kinase n=1 Tax=Nocardia sp. NPDC049707 TaxID=3154735 RepID=UPI003448F08D
MPAKIDRYTVDRELGSGGMGEVYLAHSPGGDQVAVKLIRSDKHDPETRARFEREALIARTVIGTGRVARFLNADPFAERPWMAMEYVPGRTLLTCIDADGVLPSLFVASLGVLLAEGLEAVHAAKLLHRDLKPQNVIMGRDGPMIIDFGLGAFLDGDSESLSRSGMVVGTIRCMPPEQARGSSELTTAADVYALGAVLLYAAARKFPYDGIGWNAVLAQVTNPDIGPDLHGVPEDLVPLIASMLAFEPRDRPTLNDIAGSCISLMESAGRTPVGMRHALIARTTSGGTSEAAEEPPPALIESRDEIGNHERSPLDEGPEDAESDESAPAELPTPDTGKKERREVTGPRGQRPASSISEAKLVADELRAQYAMSAVL